MRISDWSSDVCSSDLIGERQPGAALRFGHQCVEKSRGFDRVPQRRRVAACLDGAHDRRSAGALEQSLERREKFGSVHQRSPSPRAMMPRKISRVPPRSEKLRSEEHTSELQSLMRISYAVFCLKK